MFALLALASTLANAQENNKKGYLTGSFETNITKMIVKQMQNLRKTISVRTII